MIRFKDGFPVAVWLCVLLVASRATCDEPKRSVPEPSPRALHGFETVRMRAFPRPPAIAFGLRLPRFLAIGSGSPPALAPRAVSHGPRPTECRHQCASGAVTDRTRKTASTILAGVGALGVTAGVVLNITTPPRSDQPTLAPSFRLKLSGQRAIASADWRF
ncbi:MAG TPA: hypothetical protein VFZ53_00960 [Polyangiaceae bacterium]